MKTDSKNLVPVPVLVVDDTESNRYLMARLLQLNGFSAACAGSGRDALNAIPSVQPALILLDLHMPGMDGLAVLAALKQNAKWRNVPVVMVTAADDPATVAEAARLGAQDYLVKSKFSVEQLLQCVNRHVASQPNELVLH